MMDRHGRPSVASFGIPALLFLGWSPVGARGLGEDAPGRESGYNHQEGRKRRLDAGYRHLGCFNDENADPGMTMELEAFDLTLDGCYQTCLGSNESAYFATQNGKQCWCSAGPHLDYSRGGVGKCDHWCGGDSSSTCGGADARDYYAMEDSPEAAFTEEVASSPLDRLLELHNAARCMHDAPALKFDNLVAISARAYAETLASEENCGSNERAHSTGLGENVFVCASSSEADASCFSPSSAMAHFYESQVGSGGSPSTYGDRTTQVLWKPTTELGCALEDCTKEGLTYNILVCHYSPPVTYGVATGTELSPRTKTEGLCGYA